MRPNPNHRAAAERVEVRAFGVMVEVAVGGKVIQPPLSIFHLVILYTTYTKRRLNDPTARG